MKKIFTGVFAISMAIHATAQHKIAVPQKVTDAFTQKYSAATNVKWEKEKAYYEASFNYQSQKMSALYNSSGDQMETETAISIETLSPAIRKYASSKGRITEAARIIKADGTVLYEAEVNHTDLLFDDNGHFIKEQKD
jgi:hypothetical protein